MFAPKDKKKGKKDERSKSKKEKKSHSPRSRSADSRTPQTWKNTHKTGAERPKDEQLLGAAAGYFFDCCAILILCAEHGRIGLRQLEYRVGLWLPYVVVQPTDVWEQKVASKLKQLLHFEIIDSPQNHGSYLCFSEPRLVNYLRLQIPGGEFLTRAIYFTQVKSIELHKTTYCCTSTTDMIWHSVNELPDLTDSALWGPEPHILGTACATNVVHRRIYKEYTLQDALKYLPREDSSDVYSLLLKSANFGRNEIINAYAEFMQHIYPAQHMCQSALHDYLTKIGVFNSGLDYDGCYRAFTLYNNPYVSFGEFVLGIAAMDKDTDHSGEIGEIRLGFIFRYYDVNSDGSLSRMELEKMVSDSLRLRQEVFEEEIVQKQTDELYSLLGVPLNAPFSFETMAKCNNESVLRASSVLFRCPFSFAQQLVLKRVYGSVSNMQAMHSTECMTESWKKQAACHRCRTKKYTLTPRTVRIKADGTVENGGILAPESESFTPGSSERRSMSLQQLSEDNPAYKMLVHLRDYGVEQKLVSPKLKSKKIDDFWSKGDVGHLASMVLKLLQDAEKIFRQESRCIKINTPCYVLGDILGNFRDLLIFEKSLWEKGPHFSPSNYVFLGNYTEKGNYGLECLMYLLSCKVLDRFRFFMLRGSNELGEVQKTFSLEKQCLEKFGRFGTPIWEACNKVFDALPLCAIIDESIFCVHSGIPSRDYRTEEVNAAPVPLIDAEKQFLPAVELLWNTPLSPQEWREQLDAHPPEERADSTIDNAQGFVANRRSGKGYFFNEEATSAFLTANGLTHIIRSHEAPRTGYQCHLGGRLLTIFSSSFYSGRSNEATAAFVEGNKIRVMRLETGPQ